MRSWLIIVLDSCRADSFAAASPEFSKRFDKPFERRFSYATWTAPSHYSMLSGLLPHKATPEETRATPALYRDEFAKHVELLNIESCKMLSFAPGLWMPSWLQGLGYKTAMSASLPVLNPSTPMNCGFDVHRMSRKHNDIKDHTTWLMPWIESVGRQPWFAMLNVGETHYPYYTRYSKPDKDIPILNGLHGVAKRFGSGQPISLNEKWLTTELMDRFRFSQIQSVVDIDRDLCALFDNLKRGTRVTVTADHGEAFGEKGWFGHGPVPDEIVLEVPYLDGVI